MIEEDGWYCDECYREMPADEEGIVCEHCNTSFCSQKCVEDHLADR